MLPLVVYGLIVMVHDLRALRAYMRALPMDEIGTIEDYDQPLGLRDLSPW